MHGFHELLESLADLVDFLLRLYDPYHLYHA